MASGSSLRVVLSSGARVALRWPLEGNFELFLDSGAKAVLRWPLEAHFELVLALVPERLSEGLWKLILSSFRLWCQNGSQMAPSSRRAFGLKGSCPVLFG